MLVLRCSVLIVLGCTMAYGQMGSPPPAPYNVTAVIDEPTPSATVVLGGTLDAEIVHTAVIPTWESPPVGLPVNWYVEFRDYHTAPGGDSRPAKSWGGVRQQPFPEPFPVTEYATPSWTINTGEGQHMLYAYSRASTGNSFGGQTIEVTTSVSFTIVEDEGDGLQDDSPTDSE